MGLLIFEILPMLIEYTFCHLFVNRDDFWNKPLTRNSEVSVKSSFQMVQPITWLYSNKIDLIIWILTTLNPVFRWFWNSGVWYADPHSIQYSDRFNVPSIQISLKNKKNYHMSRISCQCEEKIWESVKVFQNFTLNLFLCHLKVRFVKTKGGIHE